MSKAYPGGVAALSEVDRKRKEEEIARKAAADEAARLARSEAEALAASLKPGGFLIYKTYTAEQKNFAGGPSHPMFLLEPNELLHAFSSMRVLHYHETIREKGVAELVARK